LTEELQAIVKLALERVLAREQRCAPPRPAQPDGGPGAPGGGGGSFPVPSSQFPVPSSLPPSRRAPGDVVLASDHGGFDLKQDLAAYLRDAGYPIRDLGTHSSEAVDYPDYALKVAAAVAKGDAWRGIMVDGVGVGSAMAANKVPGIRAATCFDVFSTRNAREHNDANVLCLGGRVLEPAKAREMARLFLETDFGGDRHARRVEKIVAIERLFLGAAAGRQAT
jgi:ribose 5-phosphate isomerase B